MKNLDLEVDYKKLNRGDFILVNTCFGVHAAKFIGYTEANSVLGHYPRFDVVHYFIIGESLKEIKYFKGMDLTFPYGQSKSQNGMYGYTPSHYPRDIIKKLNRREILDRMAIMHSLTRQFDFEYIEPSNSRENSLK